MLMWYMCVRKHTHVEDGVTLLRMQELRRGMGEMIPAAQQQPDQTIMYP